TSDFFFYLFFERLSRIGVSVGLLQPRLFYASFFVHLIYRPLTVVEERYWYMVVPQDDVWPYTLHTTL
ncbi:hypothetical protein, partial [Psychrobacter sp.]